MTAESATRRYRNSYRRLLIDMHIPDWDERFLSEYDPSAAVAAAAAAGATGLMVYFQSHVGLCNWPTRSGEQHQAFRGRDPMAETVDAAAKLKLPLCAYYSVNFNNWAYLKHPEWRLQPISSGLIGGGILQRPRYGLCCLNHPEYRAFVREQATEIISGYSVDALFFDMVWWMSLCGCEQCHTRYRTETGHPIPQVIDWLDPDWCRFQDAREHWITELTTELRDHAKSIRQDVDVYHNFALGMHNWTRGVSFESSAGHDFLGGDFYGGREEQLVISRLMLNLSANRPMEFMTTITSDLAQHEQLRPFEEIQTMNLAATAIGSAFLTIAAVDPVGTLNQAMFDYARMSFDKARVYEPYLGGEPVEDIGIYYSSESKMSFADNGKPLAAAPTDKATDYPHFAAVRGACQLLNAAHLPFGVITRRQLQDLRRYRVVVLPNVLRMDEQEVQAFRDYVSNGGNLYASCFTALTRTDGVRMEDFMLQDVFGCHFEALEDGLMIHLAAEEPGIREAIAPQRFLSHRVGPREQPAAIRLKPDSIARTLAYLNLPYGYPSAGAAEDSDWSAIHSSPPWTHTSNPLLVQNSFGRGSCIYSAIDLEADNSTAHGRLFLQLIRQLGPRDWSFETEATPNVWIAAFDQANQNRWVISLLNYPAEFPASADTPIKLKLRPPEGKRFVSLVVLPDERPLAGSFESTVITTTVPAAGPLRMIAANYEDR